MLLVLCDLLREALNGRLVGDVRGDGDDVALRVRERRAPRLRGLLERLCASADVDASVVVSEGLGDQKPDACAAAGRDGDPALDVKEAFGGNIDFPPTIVAVDMFAF